MKLFTALATLALWSVADGAVQSLDSRIRSSLMGLKKATTHKRELLKLNAMERAGKQMQHASESTAYGEVIVDTLGDIVGVDTECDHKKDQYAADFQHANNMIIHWNQVEDNLEVEFQDAVSKTRLCEANINKKFDYYGCNKPTNEAGRIAMGNELAAIQNNCIEDSSSGGRACTDADGGAWNNIPGGLKQVEVSDDGSKVWGVNGNDDIYFRAGRAGHWIHIGGKLKQISVTGDGSYVWGVNSNDDIYYRAGQHGGWVNVPGKLKQLDVTGNGASATVWGVNSGDYIYYRHGIHGSWVNVGGRLSHIAVSSDGNHIWGVNSGHNIYYRAGVHGGWQHVPGGLRTISVNADGTSVWGTNSGHAIYQRNGFAGAWTHVSGGLIDVNVAGAGNFIWGVNIHHHIYDRTCSSSTPRNNFEDIKVWMQRIEDDSSKIPQELENWTAARQTAKNNYDEWVQKCSWGALFDDIANAIISVAKAIVKVIVDIIKAIGCLIIDIALSVVGAILDGILATVTGGATKTMALTPIGIFICGAPDFAPVSGPVQPGAAPLRANNGVKGLAIPSAMSTLKSETANQLRGKSLEAALTKSPEIIGAGFLGDGGTAQAGLLSVQASSNRSLALSSSKLGFSKQEAFDFLFKFIMAILKEVGKHDCCTALGSFLDDNGDTIDIIQWLMMRAVDAFCGNFGTFIMEIIKQLAFCNLCEICPKDACTLKFLAFRNKCKEYYGGLIETGATGNLTMAEADTMLLLGDGVLGVRTDPIDVQADFHIVSGNPGNQDCNVFCKANGYPFGAIGHDVVQVDVGDDDHEVEMYAESPLHSDENGNSPCCPAGNQWGKGTTCSQCKCATEPQSNLGAAWSGRLNCMYILEQHGSTHDCHDFLTAKARCEAASDCHGIATQSNVCGGKYRVAHGTKATMTCYSNWKPYNLWAYSVDRSKLPGRACTDADGGAWNNIPGGLKQVEVSDDGSKVWGVNGNDDIYFRAGRAGHWIHIGGKLKQISVTGDGSYVWGVNSNDDIYYRAGQHGGWVNVPGKLKQLDVMGNGAAATVWGVNSGDYIYYRHGTNGAWVNVGGRLSHIAVSSDGNHIWGVNSAGNIYYRAGVHGGWQHVPGGLRTISVNRDGTSVWGTNSGHAIYQRNGFTGAWTRVSGGLIDVNVAGDGTSIWGVNANHHIYDRTC